MTCPRLAGRWIPANRLGLDGPEFEDLEGSPHEEESEGEDSDMVTMPDGSTRFGPVFKVWTPYWPDGLILGWADVFTTKAGKEEPLVMLRATEWTVVDIDGAPKGGAPRGVVGEVKTDRGWQQITPRPGVRSAAGDAKHSLVSQARGAYGMRVESPASGAPRTLRPGPGIAPGLPGWRTFEALAACWQAAGGLVDWGTGQPRRRAGIPRTVGRLDGVL